MTPAEADLVASFVREHVATGWADPEWPTDADLTRIADELEAWQPPKQYPFVDGPHLVIGPECFTGDGVEVDQEVVSWRGENYYLEPKIAAAVLSRIRQERGAEASMLEIDTIVGIAREFGVVS